MQVGSLNEQRQPQQQAFDELERLLNSQLPIIQEKKKNKEEDAATALTQPLLLIGTAHHHQKMQKQKEHHLGHQQQRLPILPPTVAAIVAVERKQRLFSQQQLLVGGRREKKRDSGDDEGCASSSSSRQHVEECEGGGEIIIGHGNMTPTKTAIATTEQPGECFEFLSSLNKYWRAYCFLLLIILILFMAGMMGLFFYIDRASWLGIDAPTVDDSAASPSSALSSAATASSSTAAPPPQQRDAAAHQGRKQLRNVFFEHAFVCVAVGAFILISCLVLWGAEHGVWHFRLQDYGRGYRPWIHSMGRTVLQCATIAALLCVFAVWVLLLRTNAGYTQVFKTLSVSLTHSLNEILKVVIAMQSLLKQLPALYPSAAEAIPEGATSTLVELYGILNVVKGWSTHGEQLARAAFRANAVIVFFSLQVVLSGCALGLMAAQRRRSSGANATGKLFAVATFGSLLSLGVVWLVYDILSRVHDTLILFESRSLSLEGLQEATGLSGSSNFVQLYGMCVDGGALSPAFLGNIVTQLLNNLGSNSGGEEAQLLKSLNATQLLEQADYVKLQVESIRTKIIEHPELFPGSKLHLARESLPALAAALTVLSGLVGIVDCTLIRVTLSTSIPILKRDVIDVLLGQIIVRSVLVFCEVVVIIAACVAAYVFARPAKTWYEPLSNRWFRLHCSYRAHQRVLYRRLAAVEEEQEEENEQKRVLVIQQPPTQKQEEEKGHNNNFYPHNNNSTNVGADDVDDVATTTALSHRERMSRKVSLILEKANDVKDLPLESSWSRFAVLTWIYRANITTSVSLWLSAILLILWGLFQWNTLHLELIFITLLCILVPMPNLPAEFAKNPKLRVLLRLLASCMALGIVLISVLFSIWAGNTSESCLQQVGESRAASGISISSSDLNFSTITTATSTSNGTGGNINVSATSSPPLQQQQLPLTNFTELFEDESSGHVSQGAYPFPKGCSLDVVLAHIEVAIYSASVGVVALLCALSSISLSCAWKVHHYLASRLNLYFGERDHNKPLNTLPFVEFFQSKLRRARRSRFFLSITAGVVLLFCLLVVLFSRGFHLSEVNEANKHDAVYAAPHQGCNGKLSNCRKRLNELLWFTTHNSMSTLDDGFVVPNHFHSMKLSLQHGVRSFMLDVHPFLGQAMLCHEFCVLGNTPLTVTFSELHNFLLFNPTEVIVLILEQYTPTSWIVQDLKRTNLGKFLWLGPTAAANGTGGASPTAAAAAVDAAEWPIYSELVRMNKRLVIFTDAKQPDGRGLPLTIPLPLDGDVDDTPSPIGNTVGNSTTMSPVPTPTSAMNSTSVSSNETETTTTQSPQQPAAENDEKNRNIAKIIFEDDPETQLLFNGFLYLWDYAFDTPYAFKKSADFNCHVGRGSFHKQTVTRVEFVRGSSSSSSSSTSSTTLSPSSSFSPSSITTATPTTITFMMTTREYKVSLPRLAIINHFLTYPVGAPYLAAEANRPLTITQRYYDCLAMWKPASTSIEKGEQSGGFLRPNFIAVDFWTIGNPLHTVMEIIYKEDEEERNSRKGDDGHLNL